MRQIVPTPPPPSAGQSDHVRPQRSYRTRRQGESLVVRLDALGFAFAWAMMLITRGVCIAYCAGAVSALLMLDHPSMEYYVDLLRPGVKFLLRPAAAAFVLVATAHMFQIARMVLASIDHNRLSLGGEFNQARSTPSSGHPVVLLATRAWNELYSRYGFFGVESPYYEWRYIVRETIEVVSQSVQAFNSSVLIGRQWINHVYVAIVVINCVSTPIIQRVAKQRKWSLGLERLLCVAIDTVLDLGTAILLPFVLLLPYANALDWDFGSFDYEHLYNDVWFINLINENRQIFPLSKVDFAFKFVAHASIYLSLGSMRSILRPPCRPRPASTKGPSRSILRPRSRGMTNRQLPSASPRRWYCRPLSGRMANIIHTGFIVWAAIILACHLLALSLDHPNDRHQVDGCKQQLRPWLVTKSACSVYEYNCYRRRTNSMDEDGLDFLDSNALAVLIIAHCPALRVSSSIRVFPRLLGFEIYNSTLLEWGSSAAITAKTHPEITYAFLIRTSLSQIPPGLLDPDIPKTLMDIELSHTNISSVPDNLDRVWSRLRTLYIEFAQLTAVPEALLRMQLSDFSLIGNKIAELPDMSKHLVNYFMLSLAKNPIHTLPSNFAQLKGMQYLNLVETEIQTLPHWMSTIAASASQIFLRGTPFCEAKSLEEIAAHFGASAKLSCTYCDPRIQSRYPLAITEPLMAP